VAYVAGDLVVRMNWSEYVWLPRIGPHLLNEETIAVIERGTLTG
jgi:hypothetical protein